ncbi:Nuclear valosin-containing protein-like [Apodemus speciosus]|uniref:Nuclear valosin-containing protein-like n=1 Tax=Apodemus speciosus TaxID=105296 RepID=A0ABQ0EFT6_APOSI
MKPRPAVFVDRKLKQRVVQYLTSNRCGKYVDTGVLASDLQRMYRLFSIISSEKELQNLKELEDGHLAKRARQDEEDEYTESYSDDDSNMEDYPDSQSANHMNSSLLSLYRKGNSDSVSTTPKLEQREAATSTPSLTSKTDSIPLKTAARESEGGWFIDKTPGGKKESLPLDLSDDQSNYKKIQGLLTNHNPQQTTNNPPSLSGTLANLKDSSLLESDKKRKGRAKDKGNKRKTEDLQEVDGEIEAILQKKAKARSTELQISNVKFEDVGGNDATLKEVCKMLIHMRHPEVYQHLGVVPPRGVLLHGPPGCGKTLLAHAIAGELDLPILKVAAPEIVSGVSGESEQKLRDLFDQAVSNAPCIVFIDEIDAITPKREVASKDMERRIVAQLLTCMDGASVRVVNQLLTEMDGLETRQQVFILAATNRPGFLIEPGRPADPSDLSSVFPAPSQYIIDPAILRPGRLDKTLFVGLPPPADRIAILKTITKNGTKPPLDEDVNLETVANDPRCNCYTGADLSALVREASLCALRQEITGQKNGIGTGELKVSHKHFEEAFRKVKPSISIKDQMMYESLQRSLSQ